MILQGMGGPINTILSWRAWVPLARLSYCIYLVHMTVLSYYASLASYTVAISHPLGRKIHLGLSTGFCH